MSCVYRNRTGRVIIMLCICEAGKGARELKHSDQIFHQALKYVETGEYSFRIVDDDGSEYGLAYINNDQHIHSCPEFPTDWIDLSQPLFPDYFDYDEYDRDHLYLKIFDPYSDVYLRDLNEYTVAIARLLLAFTDKKVYISDRRFLRFIRPTENLTVQPAAPEIRSGRLMTVVQPLVMAALPGKYDLVDSLELFHNVFCHQYLSSLSELHIKGVVVTVPKTEGIGSILNYCTRMMSICSRYGVEMVVKPHCTRYEDEMLNRYFKLPFRELNLKSAMREHPENKYEMMNNLLTDAQGNYYIDIYPTTALTHEYYQTHQAFLDDPHNTLTLDILSDRFLNDLKTYKEAVFQDKRVLGVLVRGTDYIVYRMPDQPLQADELIRLIRQVREDGKYDKIFLATEDKDYYRTIVEAFPKELIAISQTRISRNDFKDCLMITDLEKKTSTPESYPALIEDNMVNYFYALYLLSQCDGFLATPPCNGVSLVRSFNRGQYDFFRVVQAEKPQ